jgi:hypothetical protein
MNALAPSPSQPPLVAPYGLVSLWDMLRKYAAEFVLVAELIKKLQEFEPGSGKNALLRYSPIELDQKVRSYLPAVVTLTQTISLPSVADQIERIKRQLQSPTHTQQEMINLMAELRHRLDDELNKQWFFHVKPEHVRYYNEPDLFGQEVSQAFPGARDSIEAAGKCLSLEQGTACVFHLMAPVELVLRAIGKDIGIDYSPSWEGYIRQINKKVDAPYKDKSADWIKKEEAYKDILGDLIAVKHAWRNPTHHVARKYLPSEAEEVFRAVRAFMQHAASMWPVQPTT